MTPKQEIETETAPAVYDPHIWYTLMSTLNIYLNRVYKLRVSLQPGELQQKFENGVY